MWNIQGFDDEANNISFVLALQADQDGECQGESSERAFVS
jgi:hypothetical protein